MRNWNEANSWPWFRGLLIHTDQGMVDDSEAALLELSNVVFNYSEIELVQRQAKQIAREIVSHVRGKVAHSTTVVPASDEQLKRDKGIVVTELLNVLSLSTQAYEHREMSRLDRLSTQAPDYNVGRTWIELILELPWTKASESPIDIVGARQILADDHYGLKDVKERILEHLGVLKLNPGAKAPILCFVGPPGVGKTSLGQSIARALGRKFERLSLGGMHDEAELRGHRRTYIGAMAGRIIQSIRRAGVNNPVLMLDEVDKLGRDFRGDPAAALLEILDPEQNKTFRDNYLDLPFDISKVFFVMTANTLDTIPQPLLDRMEVVRLAGYSEEEKLEIARRYQIPKQLKEAGLSADVCVLSDEVLRLVVSRYTREAGVRQLERTIGRIMRKAALKVAEGSPGAVEIQKEGLTDLLGPERLSPQQARKNVSAGVATGLAWTEAGGDVLYIEALLLKDGKGLSLTGQLGDVMKESAKTRPEL